MSCGDIPPLAMPVAAATLRPSSGDCQRAPMKRLYTNYVPISAVNP